MKKRTLVKKHSSIILEKSCKFTEKKRFGKNFALDFNDNHEKEKSEIQSLSEKIGNPLQNNSPKIHINSQILKKRNLWKAMIDSVFSGNQSTRKKNWNPKIIKKCNLWITMIASYFFGNQYMGKKNWNPQITKKRNLWKTMIVSVFCGN